MSKQVRLEFPLYNGNDFIPKVWLQIVGNETKAYSDMDCTTPIFQNTKKISIDVKVPDELELVEISKPSTISPVDDISLTWCWLDSRQNLQITGLQKVFVIFDDRSYNIPVDDERPDREKWCNYTSINNDGRLLFFKKWALVVYVLKDKNVGCLYWSTKLIEQ